MRPTVISQRDWWLDACLLFVLAATLVFPLFRLKYLNNWPSIESTFIADGRMLQANWPHHLWQPLWYCGTRADYVYPPGLRDGVAILSTLLRISPARSYHFFIGLFYAFGISAVYLWTRTGTGSRGAAWLAAAGVALISPCFLILPDVRMDSPFLVPWRLHVLMKYGEGPHISALSVLPLAWLGASRRFLGGGVRWLLLSACAAALVVTINFYGATALAITLPLVAWSCFLKRRDWRVLRDAIFIAALAYGLTAWWLVPSYLRITSRNLRLVSPEGNKWSLPVVLIILLVYIALSLVLRKLRHCNAYVFFIWSGLWFLGVYVLGYHWFGLQVAGSSMRLVPELDLFAILCGAQLARSIWVWRPNTRVRLVARVAVALVIVLCFFPERRYLRHAYVEFPRDRQWQQRLEYRTADWLGQNFPNQRVFSSGTIRFWYNVWQDGQQADGGSQQGILNPLLPTAQWRILHAVDPALARDWLQALGVDVLVVPGPSSKEPYKDFAPQQVQIYEALLPLLKDDGEGNRYYKIPRRAAGIVRVVDSSRFRALQPVPAEYENVRLRAYVDALEATPPPGDAPDRAHARWLNSDALDIEVESRTGEALLVEESYDPYWRAYVDGRALSIKPDAIGFMLVETPPGKHSVRMVFETPLEVFIGRALTLASLALIAFLLVRYKSGRQGAGELSVIE
jgi:hypothetical protein